MLRFLRLYNFVLFVLIVFICIISQSRRVINNYYCWCNDLLRTIYYVPVYNIIFTLQIIIIIKYYTLTKQSCRIWKEKNGKEKYYNLGLILSFPVIVGVIYVLSVSCCCRWHFFRRDFMNKSKICATRSLVVVCSCIVRNNR